ncbi:group II intron reverse transcriptase/maturase [Bythopirellula polymerisocia]|uniref:Group II intron-encoded protein LtrA n=1 Tax=Bythopirellula polymerisocia TaxID=2528003 RepID=A0A5C6BYQ0_9BACT|nr:group II intron reverse transcriptase/maturase [Bythopirellula polymerisocia]TWU17460.1 Group II intron-encoded protein LtrA [Bythopirellula polymerisocia]
MLSAGTCQLAFAFADSPHGGKDERTSDESKGKSYLLLRANTKEVDHPATWVADDTSRLLEQVASVSNLARALLNVARNKGAAGVDGRGVREVVEASPQLLAQLRRELLSGTYLPGDIRRVWIPKSGGGHRGLGIPNVVDRWVQQAVLQVLEPIFEPTFHDSSHGFRPRRGAQTAIAAAKQYLAEGYAWTVDIDLSKFFDRVHHQRLLNRLANHVKDGRLLKLVYGMLKAKVVLPDGTRTATTEGAPQGGPLSPLLSNVVLDELDWELARRGLRFVRYADDFSVFVKSERAGRRVMDSVSKFIDRRLRLLVNEDKSSVTGPNYLTFLGFQLGKNAEGQVMVAISRRTKERMDARIRELTPRVWGQSLSTCFERTERYLRGWIGYFRLCTEDSLRPLHKFDAHIRRRIRAIIIRQKKRDRYLFRHLQTRGVSRKSAAKTAFTRAGVWRRSVSYGIHQAYSNAWFAERLMPLTDRWHALNPSRQVFIKQQRLFET